MNARDDCEMMLRTLGSRDSTMGLWSISGIDSSCHSAEMRAEMQDENEVTSLAECVPVIEPVFTFSNLHSEPNTPARNGERVRSLAYCYNSYVC